MAEMFPKWRVRAMRWRYEYVCRCCLRAGRAPWATCTLCPDCRRDACEFHPPCRWRPVQPELRAAREEE